ncbi:MAG: DNA polymerase III subunit chi [Sphingomonadales bacterium]|nr:DNA polymerase III subunit chi [Sphingomonadales bacterium]MBD3772550.1 DNA polymerase III subunit chi [Paracoccaceae bacterium]
MRVDFYLLGRDGPEQAVPLLARATRNAGERMLVVARDPALRDVLSRALWEHAPQAFLANGKAGEGHEDRQPILLSDTPDPANGARYLAIADGEWRDEALGFDRVFLLFGEAARDAARGTWRSLGEQDGVERYFWSQQGGKWEQVG